MLLVMGDFNAKVGRREPTAMSSAVGLYGLRETNEAGEQLENFCLEHELALANTMFKQHPMRLYTWTSLDGMDHQPKQIDYISVSQRWKTSLMNCCTRTCLWRRWKSGWLKEKDSTAFASESQGTQGRQKYSLQQRWPAGLWHWTEWGHPRRSLKRYQDSPAGGGQRNGWIRQVGKEKEMDIWWDLCSNQGKERSKR